MKLFPEYFFHSIASFEVRRLTTSPKDTPMSPEGVAAWRAYLEYNDKRPGDYINGVIARTKNTDKSLDSAKNNITYWELGFALMSMYWQAIV